MLSGTSVPSSVIVPSSPVPGVPTHAAAGTLYSAIVPAAVAFTMTRTSVPGVPLTTVVVLLVMLTDGAPGAPVKPGGKNVSASENVVADAPPETYETYT